MSAVLVAFAMFYSVTLGHGQARISNDIVSVCAVEDDGRIVGFQVTPANAGNDSEITVLFGSLSNITAATALVRERDDEQALRFGPLMAAPTPQLASTSYVTVTLYKDDPYPKVSFNVRIDDFDRRAWERTFGEVPFHFLVCTLPGAEIFHQRGWPIPTPAIDKYPQMLAEGPGRQIVSTWSRDWTYAPPIGAYPLPTVGLWKPSTRQYVAYDFHHARLTDNSEKKIGSSYCWRLKSASEFFALVWPYAAEYNRLRYPEPGDAFGSHFRLLYDTNMAGDDDPNRFVIEYAWQHYADLLPDAPMVNDVSWYPNHLRFSDFPRPRLGWLYTVAGQNARWEEPGAVTARGIGYTASPIDYVFRQGDEQAITRLMADIEYLLSHAVKQTIAGDECVFWVKPIEGQMARMFGPGVETIHNIQGWGVAQALLDTYRNDPDGQARLLPYIDGVLRYTKHILYTRNGYPDVPAAQFAWGAGPVAHFCLSYYYTFRNDPQRQELATLALKLARNMTYRYLAIWTSDNDQMDDIDAAYFMEPNAGLLWLGAACANEIWVVCHALAEVYVATGDPILGQYLQGMLEKWPLLARDEYYPTIGDYGTAWAERYGLFEGCQQGKGQRSTYGGIWGGFEQLSWPIGKAQVRVLCGEKSALVFNRNGVHTDIERYSAGSDGSFSFRLTASGPRARLRTTDMDVVVSAPFFDLTTQRVVRQREGRAVLLKAGTDYQTFPQRPDTLLIYDLRHGDTLIIGTPPVRKFVSRKIVKPRAFPARPSERVREFTLINLAPQVDTKLPRNWDDPTSFAGLHGGRRVIFGVPYDLVDPDLAGGKVGVRRGRIPVNESGRHLFVLVAQTSQEAHVNVQFADGHIETMDATAGLPVIVGWPPLFQWHVDLLHRPVKGTIRSISPRNAVVLAVTVAGPQADLRETLAALREKQRAIEARRRTVAGLAELKDLFEYFAGHIAVLPVPPPSSAQASSLMKLMREAELADYLTFLSPQQLADGHTLSARNFWLLLYLGGEQYYHTVNTDADGVEAIRRYLREGGTLVVLSSEPFPFYYNQHGQRQIAAPQLGLPICGSGLEGRRDRLRAARRLNISGWEKPPEGRQLTFRLNPNQQIITSLPAMFEFPKTGDPRWRPIANIFGESQEYTPILTLFDEERNSYGDGAAMINYQAGDLAGGCVVYVWATLVYSTRYQALILTDLMRYLLNNTVPPPAQALCFRAESPISIDGRLDEPAWQGAPPLGRFSCFGTKRGFPKYQTTAKVLWDEDNLYVGFVAADEDIWSEITDRDGPLWEGEVVEVYVDPEGDGRDYLEFEVNPLNTVIDLKIERQEDGRVTDWQTYAKWNAKGWQTAVIVDGDTRDRKNRDRQWTVEMAIPLRSLVGTARRPPKIGDTWRVQLYRIDRSNTLDEAEYSGWSPTDTFHRPAQFGILTFAGSLYNDDFSNYPPGSNGAPLWRISAGEWQVQDGSFRGRDSGTSRWTPTGAVMGVSQWTDYILRLRFKIVSRGSDWRDGPWIGFRYTGPDSTYSLNFSSRDVQLHKAFRGRSSSDDSPMAAAAWTPDDEWHEIEIRTQGAQIAATLDGTLLFEVTDANHLGVPPVPVGGICLSARRWDESQGHTVVLFDDIRIVLQE